MKNTVTLKSTYIEQLRVMVDKFNQVESDLELFFENLPVLFFVACKDGNLTKINKEWTNYLGWTKEELMSKPWIEFVHPDDKQKTLNVANIKDGDVLEGFENRYVCKDGSYKTIKWYATSWIKEKNYGVAFKT